MKEKSLPIVSKIGKKLENRNFKNRKSQMWKFKSLKKREKSRFVSIFLISSRYAPVQSLQLLSTDRCKIFLSLHRGWFLDSLDSFFFFLYIPFSISVAGCRKLELKGCHVWDHTAIQCEGSRLKVRNNLNCYFYRTVEYFFSWFPTSKRRGGRLEFWIFVAYKFETYGNSMFPRDTVQPRRRLMITFLRYACRLYGVIWTNESRKCFFNAIDEGSISNENISMMIHLITEQLLSMMYLSFSFGSSKFLSS